MKSAVAKSWALPAVGGRRYSAGAPVAAPAWWLAQGDLTWSTPVTNTLADVFPEINPGIGGPGDITDAWNGACVDQVRKELILAGNGGHGNYAGNETYAVDLRQEAPEWRRLSDPSTNVGGSDDEDDTGDGEYPDGKFRSVHGWHSCTWGNGKVWYPLQAGVYPSGFAYGFVWSWDRDSLGDGPFPVSAAESPWVKHGHAIDGNLTINFEAGCGGYDKLTNRVWGVVGAGENFAGQSYWWIDGDTGAITPVDVALVDQRPRWSALAPDLGIWIFGCMHDGPKLSVFNLASPAVATDRTPTGSLAEMVDGAGAVYHQVSRAVLVYDDSFGPNIRKLAIPANPFTGTYVGSTITPHASNVIEPPGDLPGDYPGVYCKFNIIEDMGDGRSALLVVFTTDGPLYVFALPAAGV